MMTKHDEHMMESAIADTIYRETGEKTLNTTLDAIIQTIKRQCDHIVQRELTLRLRAVETTGEDR
jgi:hypothetical protein